VSNLPLSIVQIRLKLMGTLKGKMPAGGAIEVPDGASIDDVLRALNIAPQAIRVFTVNGAFERDRKRVLAPDDELSAIPPVGGG
jgi:sulfur carrier protein ThiS